jgi:alpha-tubulin suppressor-like RCC1 family protein
MLYAKGTGDNKDVTVPTRITKFAGLDSSDKPVFTQVAGGYHHSLALTNTGRIYAWGYGEHGQLGLGDKKRQSYPHSVDGFRSVTFTAISASEFHSVALSADGSAYAWGHNRQNQLGYSESENKDRPKPKLIDTPVKFISISAGSTHTLAVSCT